TASTLSHFNYDGFILRVRDRSARQSLGLAGGTADVMIVSVIPSWAWHGFKCVAIFVLPLGTLWFWQTHLAIPELQRHAWVVADVPVGSKQHLDYGAALQQEGQLEKAAEEFKLALKFNQRDARTHMNLATALTAQSKFDEAVPHMESAVRLEPRNGELHGLYGN